MAKIESLPTIFNNPPSNKTHHRISLRPIEPSNNLSIIKTQLLLGSPQTKYALYSTLESLLTSQFSYSTLESLLTSQFSYSTLKDSINKGEILLFAFSKDSITMEIVFNVGLFS